MAGKNLETVMEFRTIVEAEPSREKVSHLTGVMFTGSCFASEIGSRMADGKMKVFINPTGTVYNPASVLNAVDLIISGRQLDRKDLYNHNGTWISFLHYTDFNSDNPDEVLSGINISVAEAHKFLKEAEFLFITFGTSRVFRFKETGRIVSNCHKIPAAKFTTELLSPDKITEDWLALLDRIKAFNRRLKTVFTISPVRHWKDGAHGNQVSKSILFLAVERLISHPSSAGYFPGYELLMDDLRDYRYYADDMLHPSPAAIDYIWEKFAAAYLEEASMALWKECMTVTRASRHIPGSGSAKAVSEFASGMISRIEAIQRKAPYIDFSVEKIHFGKMLNLQ